jgi:hypothetical protein
MELFGKLLNFVNLQITDNSIFYNDDVTGTVMFVGNLPTNIDVFHKKNLQKSLTLY